jgi:hypothetical protein
MVFILEFGKLFLEFACRRGLERLLVVLVEVARVAVLALGYERRFDLFLVDGDPFGRREPLVALDVVDAIFQVAEALRQVDLEQIAQEVLEVRAEVRRKSDLARHDLLVDLYGLVGKERWVAGSHLIDKYAQSPPINSFVVTLNKN